MCVLGGCEDRVCVCVLESLSEFLEVSRAYGGRVISVIHVWPKGKSISPSVLAFHLFI